MSTKAARISAAASVSASRSPARWSPIPRSCVLDEATGALDPITEKIDRRQSAAARLHLHHHRAPPEHDPRLRRNHRAGEAARSSSAARTKSWWPCRRLRKISGSANDRTLFPANAGHGRRQGRAAPSERHVRSTAVTQGCSITAGTRLRSRRGMSTLRRRRCGRQCGRRRPSVPGRERARSSSTCRTALRAAAGRLQIVAVGSPGAGARLVLPRTTLHRPIRSRLDQAARRCDPAGTRAGTCWK